MQKSKLEKPVLSSKIIERPRLMQLLKENADKPVFVVRAPAGFGKSVAIRQWMEQQEFPAAWVNLGVPHNDLAAFLSHLTAAFRQFNPGSLEKMVHLSRNRKGRDVSDIAYEFSNQIKEMGKPLGLVLDDYHSISDPEIHLFVQSLLHYPPGSLKIVLITRSDPPLGLSRLRLYDRLFDVTTDELSFTEEEISQFLRECNSQIRDSAVQDAFSGFGGWILGIKMMLSTYFLNPNQLLKFRQDIDIEYLVDQLCSELSSEVYDALCLSTLLESFNADLLDILFEATGTIKIRGEAFIEEILRLNLFLTEDEDNKGWFRYQDLFRELIRSQCKHEESGRIRQVLSLTSDWFAKNGNVEEAVAYAVASKNWKLAVAHIAEHRTQVFEKGEWWRVESWINQLPNEIILRNHSLLLSLMWINEYTWRLREIPKLLIHLENLGSKKNLSPRDQAEYKLHLGHHYLFYHSDPWTALEYLEDSKNRFQDTGMLGGTRELCLGLALQMTDSNEQALEDLNKLEQNHPYQSPVYLRSLMTKVFVHLLSADFDKAEWESNKFYMDAGNAAYRSFKAWSHYLAGNIDFQYGRESALRHFKSATDYEEALNNRILIDSLAAIALSFALDNDEANAWKYIGKLKNRALQLRDPYLKLAAESVEKRVQLISGQYNPSLYTPLAAPQNQLMGFFFFVDVPVITQIRVEVCIGDIKDIQMGLKRIKAILNILQLNNNTYHNLDLYLLRASGYFRLGKHQKALKWLAQASLTYSHTKNIRPFNEIRKIQQEFYAWAPASHLPYEFNKESEVPVAKEPDPTGVLPDIRSRLTKREVEIARLVSLGLRNKEVSEDLNIREVTVKTHLTKIFRKLGINNRTALARMTDFL